MKRALVTGGAGFIGSHLSERLLGEGWEVYAIDDLSTGRRSNVSHLEGHERFTWTVADVTSYPGLAGLVRDADVVFHLAAAVGVKLIISEPVETLERNVQGTEVVLKAAVGSDTKVLLASTSEVYGKVLDEDDDIGALREDSDRRLGPTSTRRWAYACSKALDEYLTFAYRDEYGVSVIVTRLFNTVGPRQSGRYGMVLPRFVNQALQGEPITVFGDGRQSRSFLHVKDCVNALDRLSQTDAAEGKVFNVGHGSEISIRSLAERVRRLTRSSSEIRLVPYSEAYGEGFEDMRRRTPDVSKLDEMIGFEPTRDIDEIIEDVAAYYRKSNRQEKGLAAAQ